MCKVRPYHHRKVEYVCVCVCVCVDRDREREMSDAIVCMVALTGENTQGRRRNEKH